MHLSDLIACLNFRELSYLDFVRSNENCLSWSGEEIVHSFECSIPTIRSRLIKLNPNKIPISDFNCPPDEPDFTSCSIFELTSLPDLHSQGQIFQVIGVTYLNLIRQRILGLRILLKKIFFPFSEVFGQTVVGFFRHYVFFYLSSVFYFFMDRVGIEVHNMNSHIRLDTIEIQGPQIFIHTGNNSSLFGLEHELDVVRF